MQNHSYGNVLRHRVLFFYFSYPNQTHFYLKSFARSLVLKQSWEPGNSNILDKQQPYTHSEIHGMLKSA